MNILKKPKKNQVLVIRAMNNERYLLRPKQDIKQQVSIKTRILGDRSKNHRSILGRGKRFLPLQQHPCRLWSPPSFLRNGYLNPFHSGTAGRMNSWPHFHLMSSIQITYVCEDFAASIRLVEQKLKQVPRCQKCYWFLRITYRFHTIPYFVRYGSCALLDTE